MNLFKRIKNILQKPVPPQQEKSIFTVNPGDIMEVSLVTYQVTGKIQSLQRNAIFLTLQDGNDIRYLHIEEREQTQYQLYTPIDGRLDSFDEIPTTIELENIQYYLEEQYAGQVTVTGNTPFSFPGEQHVWRFQSNNRKLLRMEWQDGRMMMYEGEFVLPADVEIIRST